MESGIDLSVISLNEKNNYKLRTPQNDSDVVGEKLIVKKEIAEKRSIIPNRFKGILAIIICSFAFCLNSILSKMAFTLSVGDNTFVSIE